jgi:hypothetical protein
VPPERFAISCGAVEQVLIWIVNPTRWISGRQEDERGDLEAGREWNKPRGTGNEDASGDNADISGE